MSQYYPSLSPSFGALVKELAGKQVAVIGHARPDGDCIGSQVALARVLRSLGAKVVCVNADAVPKRLKYFVGDVPFVKADEVPVSEDWIPFYVDCADQSRPGEKVRKRFPQVFANLDHHLSNDLFATHNFVDAKAAAACEILAGVLFDNQLPVDENTAKALYAGIMTDTGQFRFNSTTHHTFKLAAELVAAGAHPAEAGGELYESESWGKLQLLQRFLSSLRLECGGRVCIGMLPDGIYAETGTTIEDAEGLVDYARSIEGVDIGVLIEERSGSVKGSLRAKNPTFRVDQVASLFGGGGHACAAGLNVKGTTALDFRANVLSALEAHLAKIPVS